MTISTRLSVMVSVIVIAVSAASAVTTAAAQTPDRTPDFSVHTELSGTVDDLEEAWREDFQAFGYVEGVRQMVVDWDRSGANRPPAIAQMLQAGGDGVVMAMLWRLVADDPLASGMSLEAWRQWRIGLLEAIGRFRDERSLPAVYAVIAGPEPSAQVREVATSALGRVGDEQWLQQVIEVAQSSPQKRPAIVSGLGDGRRMVALDYLVDVLTDSDDDQLRRRALRSMGDWANQWAWETSSLAPFEQEGREGRRRVVDILIEAYPELDDALRVEATKSLQLADSSTAASIAEQRARRADDERTRQLYEQLVRQLRSSPLD